MRVVIVMLRFVVDAPRRCPCARFEGVLGAEIDRRKVHPTFMR